MNLHPILWPDIILGVLIAEAILHTTRTVLHNISRKSRNHMIAQRVQEMRPAALDGYRAAVKENVHAPLG